MHFKTTKCLAVLFLSLFVLHIGPLIFFFFKGNLDGCTTSIVQRIAFFSLGNIRELKDSEGKTLAFLLMLLNVISTAIVLLVSA